MVLKMAKGHLAKTRSVVNIVCVVLRKVVCENISLGMEKKRGCKEI